MEGTHLRIPREGPSAEPAAAALVLPTVVDLLVEPAVTVAAAVGPRPIKLHLHRDVVLRCSVGPVQVEDNLCRRQGPGVHLLVIVAMVYKVRSSFQDLEPAVEPVLTGPLVRTANLL